MRENPRNVRHADPGKVCEHYFGPLRTSGRSHAVYEAPWPGDPRVNIQNDHGHANPHQVHQELAASDLLEATR